MPDMDDIKALQADIKDCITKEEFYKLVFEVNQKENKDNTFRMGVEIQKDIEGIK
jgi:hypothetical protein